MLAIAGWSAKQEKKRLADRNKATAERLRADLKKKGRLVSGRSGKVFTRLGRPSVEVSPEAVVLARRLREQPGERFASMPMGWPSVVARIATEIGETYAPATLARAVVSKSEAAIRTSTSPQNAA
jgi:hypothetical protein